MLIIYFILTIKILAEDLQADALSVNPGYTQTTTTSKNGFFFEIGGIPNPKDLPLLNRKIFRGTRVPIREHPYVVSIRRLFSHYTTGALITFNTVLTVAHPLYKVSTDELGVVAAENYSDRGKSINPVVFLVIHEDFDPYTLQSDLAMLRTYEDFHFMTNTKTIKLVGAKGKLLGYQAFVSGWGRCDFTGKELCLPRSNIFYPEEVQDPMLRTVTFTVTNNSYCSEYEAKEVPLKAGMMCLGNSRMEDPMTSCLAVPGAPLVVRGRLAGVLSWGLGCGYIFDMPLVYVNLQNYRPWINHNLEKMSTIPKEALASFFLASTSYIVEKWLNKTKPYLAKRLEAIRGYELQLFDIDLILINLLGTTYDLRDFIYDDIFHEQKENLYLNAKRTIKKTIAVKEIYKKYTKPPLLAFLNHDRLRDLGLEELDKNILRQGKGARR